MNELTWIEIIYWAFTILGATFFLLRIILMFAGGMDMGADSDISNADVSAGADVSDGDSAFGMKFMSIQGLTAFFMMFGLVGLALLSAGLPIYLTMLGGGVAGLITVVVIGLLLSQMRHLRSEGNLNVNTTIGQVGTVYLKIPAGGSGQVQVVAQGALKIFDAVSREQAPIAYGEKVRVVGVADSQTLIVEKYAQ